MNLKKLLILTFFVLYGMASVQAAVNLTLDQTTKIEGTIEVADDIDIFQINLPNDKPDYSLLIENKNNHDWALYNQSKVLIKDSYSESANQIFLKSGNYYFQVNNSVLGNYKFLMSLKANEDDVPDSIGETKALSSPLNLSATTSKTIPAKFAKKNISPTQISELDSDYFEIKTTGTNGLLQIANTGAVDTELYLYDVNGSLLANVSSYEYAIGSNKQQGNQVLIAKILRPGTYFLKASPFVCSEGSSCYQELIQDHGVKLGDYNLEINYDSSKKDLLDTSVKNFSPAQKQTTIQFHIDEYGDEDSFSLHLAENGYLLIDKPYSPYCYLFNSTYYYSLSYIADSTTGIVLSTGILEHGDYSLSCTGGSKELETITLGLSFATADTIQASIQNASLLSTIDLGSNLIGSLEYSDDKDVYKFDISNEVNLILKDSFRGNSQFSILNTKYEILPFNTLSLYHEPYILTSSYRLQPGTYFLKLGSVYGPTGYNIGFSQEQSFKNTSDDYPNAITDSKVKFLNFNKANLQLSKAISFEANGDVDVIGLELGHLGFLKLGSTQTDSTVYFDLLTENGNLISRTNYADDYLLKAGKYFLYSYSQSYDSSASRARFNVNFDYIQDDSPDFIQNGFELIRLKHSYTAGSNEVTNIITQNGSINKVADVDIYKVQFPINGIYELKIKNNKSIESVALLSRNGSELIRANTPKNSKRAYFSIPIQTGDYYLSILGSNLVGAYTIESIFSPLAIDDQPDTITSQSLTNFNHNQKEQFSIEANLFDKDIDVFKLQIPEGGGFLSLYSQGDLDTYVQIVDADNQEVLADNDSGALKNFALFENIAEGDYYIIVSLNSSNSGYYTLNSHFNSIIDDQPDDFPPFRVVREAVNTLVRFIFRGDELGLEASSEGTQDAEQKIAITASSRRSIAKKKLPIKISLSPKLQSYVEAEMDSDTLYYNFTSKAFSYSVINFKLINSPSFNRKQNQIKGYYKISLADKKDRKHFSNPVYKGAIRIIKE